MTKIKRKDIISKKALNFGKKYAKSVKNAIVANERLAESYNNLAQVLADNKITPDTTKPESHVNIEGLTHVNIDSLISSLATCLSNKSPLDQLICILKRQIVVCNHYKPIYRAKQLQLLSILEDLKEKELQ